MSNVTIPASWLTAKDAAREVPGGAMTKSGLTYLLRTGKVKGVKRGGRWWVDPKSLAAYQPSRATRKRIGKRVEQK